MPALILDSQETQIEKEIKENCGIDFIIEPNGDLSISIVDKNSKKELAFGVVSKADLDYLKAFISAIPYDP